MLVATVLTVAPGLVAPVTAAPVHSVPAEGPWDEESSGRGSEVEFTATRSPRCDWAAPSARLSADRARISPSTPRLRRVAPVPPAAPCDRVVLLCRFTL